MNEKYAKAYVALILGGIAIAVPTLVGIVFFIISTILSVVCLIDEEKAVRIIGGGTLAWDVIWLILFMFYLGSF